MTDSARSHTIVQAMCSAVESAEIWHEPFVHIFMRDVFPEDVYRSMHEQIPDLTHFKDLKHREALQKDGSSSRKVLPFPRLSSLSLPEEMSVFWKDVQDALNSKALQTCIFRRLASGLSARLGVAEEEAEGLDAWPKNGLFCDLAGYRISPHKDVNTKYVTSHFYLPVDDSQKDFGTGIYRRSWAGRVSRELNKLGASLREFQPVRSFPFLPNTGYAFVVGSQSWHGRDTLPAGSSRRLSIMNIYYRTPEVPFYE